MPAELERLSEEELLKRYCSTPPDRGAGEELFRRCLPKLRRFVEGWGSRHLHRLPRPIDRQGFLNDAESLAADKLRRNICSFAFKGSFEGWLRRIAVSAAVTEFLKVIGRSPGTRDFVPIEEAFRSKHWPSSFEDVRDAERSVLLRSLLADYSRTSNRARKCASAISLATWEGRTAKEIAKELDTTVGYTWALISHDYGELRRLFAEKLGVKSVGQI